MANIFISYSRQDKEFVERVIVQLEAGGYPVWVDREDISGGSLWREEIVHALETCPVFILMLSPNSVESDNVRRELDLALENKKPILPVMIRSTMLTRAMRYQLAGLQYIDLYSDYPAGLEKLKRGLAELGVMPQSRPPPLPLHPHPKSPFLQLGNYRLLGLFAGIVLIIITLFASKLIPQIWTSNQLPTQSVATIALTSDSDTPSVSPQPEETQEVTQLVPSPSPIAAYGLSTGCISVGLWSPYPPLNFKEDSQGCLDLTNWGVSATDGGLVIQFNNAASEVRSGIYTPLQGDSFIELDLAINQLDSPADNVLTNLAAGVIPNNPVDLDRYGQIFYQRESPKVGYPIYVKGKERDGFSEYVKIDDQYLTYQPGTLVHLVFELHADQLKVFQDGTLIWTINTNFAPKGFWLGWRNPTNGAIQAEISNLSITSQ